jgi:hypothetical protein
MFQVKKISSISIYDNCGKTEKQLTIAFRGEPGGEISIKPRLPPVTSVDSGTFIPIQLPIFSDIFR